MPGVFVQGRPVDSYPRLAPEARRGMVRRITEAGEKVLHKPCRDVTAFGPDLAAPIADMFLTMYVADGAGLAANHVGVDMRVFVYDCPDDDGVRHVGHIVNPVLDPLDASRRRLLDEAEGCLSVPGATMDVPRPDRAVVRGFGRDGEPLVIEAPATSPTVSRTRPITATGSSIRTGSPHRSGSPRCGRRRTGGTRCSRAGRRRRGVERLIRPSGPPCSAR